MPEDPTDPGHSKPEHPQPCAEVEAPMIDLATENADLKEQIAALSDNDLSASQQLMAARTELKRLQDENDHLQHLLEERNRVAELIPVGTFTVRNVAAHEGLDKSDL